ncbi:hypothetical protein T11_12465 [Trichinella zimbabwensis]|uniref:Secreted protein n=1 Tax=Trichinella zimbabwensis TaxID=268475 RepID=A0A0V1I0S3_9BILA|nr:hypothetical protein T11_12465 [Trichinella zimbabwensis]
MQMHLLNAFLFLFLHFQLLNNICILHVQVYRKLSQKITPRIINLTIIRHVRICKNTTFIKAYVYLINAQYFAFGNFSTAYGYFSKMSSIIT